MRGEGQPCLENERDYPGPVEQSTHHSHLHDHVVEANMVNDEWKGMHQREEEESISSPSMEDLDLLVRYPGG